MDIFPILQQSFAKLSQIGMLVLMFFYARTTVLLLFLPFLTHCGSKTAPASNAVTGPFDSRGNYVEEWVDSPDKWYRPSTPTSKPKSKPKPVLAKKESEPPQIAVVEPSPAPTVSAPEPSPTPVVVKPKPKPKPVVVKPKPKPKLVKYTVKKGDSLSKIAARHSVSLSALRRANGITGDLIRPGQLLTIPR